MKNKIILIILFQSCILLQALAQNKIELENINTVKGNFQFATFKTKVLNNSSEKLEVLKIITKYNRDVTFEKVETQTISKNCYQDKYQLFKNKIKLRGSEILITYNDNFLSFVHGFFAKIKDDIVQSKSNYNLKEIAFGYFKEPVKTTNEDVFKSSLIYYYNYRIEEYQLAYEVYLEAKNSFRAENVYISLADGSVLGAESKICSINFPGTAQTQYNGVQNIVTDAPTSAGPFRLFETRGPNNVIIHTRNNNFVAGENAGAFDLFDNNNNWTFAEHGDLRAGFDAHWGAEKVFDYWRTIHGRNSINGNGMPILSYFNVDMQTLTGTPVNAAWFNNRMYYGNGLFGGNVTCLDVCAHEFGHGIDDFTGNLAYERESGALDEGFADIWGACVEAWATPTKQRWLLGEDLNIGAFRSMSNPNSFGQPDTYLGNLWLNTDCGTPARNNDFCGVHTNSGVLNFWFYLLSEGGTGTNDLSNNYSVNGLSINTAAQIAYRTKLLMNNSFANYPLCRQISIQAAIQLFGACSNEVVQVTNAWFAVGVGAAYVTPWFYLYKSYNSDCSQVTVNTNFPAFSNVTWTTTNGLLINGNPSPYTVQSNTVVISSPNGLTGSISANVGPFCSTGTISFCPCQPWDDPNPVILNYPATTYDPLIAQVDGPQWATSYKWFIDNQLIAETNSSSVWAYVGCMGNPRDLTVLAVTDCGITVPVTLGEIYVGCGVWYRQASPLTNEIKLYPNPTTSKLILSLDEKSVQLKQSKTLTTFKQVSIYDNLGIIRMSNQYSSNAKQIEIDVSKLNSGIYYIEIFDGVLRKRKQFIKH